MMRTKRQNGPPRRPDERDDASDALPPWTPFGCTGDRVRAEELGLPEGEVWENSRYTVILRNCSAPESGAKLIWLSVKNRDGSAWHDWRDFQRLKNELVGSEVEAVELYPAESRLVDTSNQFHLWCFPGLSFPFGYGERLVAEDTQGLRQRPFPADCRPKDLAEVTVLRTVPEATPEGAGVPRFPLGQVVATPGALEALLQAGVSAAELLSRHAGGDWGQLDAEDRAANDRALAEGARLLSAYPLSTGERIWVISEADRSSTTLLTPEEY